MLGGAVLRCGAARVGVCVRWSSGGLQQTPLYDEHVKLKAQMVGFAGWSMPLMYGDSHTVSHNHTRKSASIFDVSHMKQVYVTGPDRIPFLERVSVADLQSLKDGHTVYSFLPNSKGGIVDDCMISRRADHIYMVVNAGCADKDWEHLTGVAKEFNVQLRSSDDALIALQGPMSQQVLQKLVSNGIDFEKMGFLTARDIAISDIVCGVTRSGYTGEDGFEISVPPTKAAHLWNLFLENADVKPAGLAVRDSLRLECGLCLYGHDIDDTTTPAEASLLWPIAPRRRQNGGFIGADVILGQIASKQIQKKRVSILFDNKGIPREGSLVLDWDTQNEIGKFTSGTFSPTLRIGLGMAYVQTKYAAISTPVKIKVRDNIYDGKVVKAPIVPTKYHTVKK